MVCARPEQLQRTGKVFFCVEHLVSTRIAGGFLFRTLRVLNRLKPIKKNVSRNLLCSKFLLTFQLTSALV